MNAGYVTDVVRSRIAESGFNVITRENILQLLQAQGKRIEDCEAECEVETGRRLGADLVVTGEILQFGSALKVNLRMHNTQSGQLLAGAQASAPDVDGLDAALAPAIDRLVAIAQGRSPPSNPIARKAVDLLVRLEFAPIGDINVGPPPQQSNEPVKSIMVGAAAEAAYTAWLGNSFGLRGALQLEPLYMPDAPTTFSLRVSALPGVRFGLGRWSLDLDWAPAFVTNSAHTGFEPLGAEVGLDSPGTPHFRVAAYVHGDPGHGQLCSGCQAGPENAGLALGIGY